MAYLPLLLFIYYNRNMQNLALSGLDYSPSSSIWSSYHSLKSSITLQSPSLKIRMEHRRRTRTVPMRIRCLVVCRCEISEYLFQICYSHSLTFSIISIPPYMTWFVLIVSISYRMLAFIPKFHIRVQGPYAASVMSSVSTSTSAGTSSFTSSGRTHAPSVSPASIASRTELNTMSIRATFSAPVVSVTLQ